MAKKLKSPALAWEDAKVMRHADWERRGARDNGGKPQYGRGGVHKAKNDYRRKPKHVGRGWE